MLINRSVSVTLGVTLVLCAPVLAQHFVEDGDAPSFPDGCGQPVTGIDGLVRSISGATSEKTGDLVDAYLIDIVEPSDFYATTSPSIDSLASAKWNTRLFLFQTDGTPAMANDDAPGAAAGPSFIGSPGLFVGPIGPSVGSLEAGRYVLVISGAPLVPMDGEKTALFDLSTIPTALVGPTPSAGDFQRWSPLGASVATGAYVIGLRNVTFIAEVTEPCLADVNCDLMVNVDDLTSVILAWGGDDPRADVDDSGEVGVDDLLAVLLGWGVCH